MNFNILFDHTDQVWRSRERVRLAAARLAVTEARGREPVDGHVDEPPNSGVLEDVLLTRLGFKHHIEGEWFQLIRLLLRELGKSVSLTRCCM